MAVDDAGAFWDGDVHDGGDGGDAIAVDDYRCVRLKGGCAGIDDRDVGDDDLWCGWFALGAHERREQQEQGVSHHNRIEL